MLARYYSDDSIGGHEAYIRNVSSLLLKKGDMVGIVVQAPTGVRNRESYSKLKSCSCILHIPYVNFPFLNIVTFAIFFALTLRRIRNDFELFVSHSANVASIATLVGVSPHIYTHHGFMYEHMVKNTPVKAAYFVWERVFMQVFAKKLSCIITVDTESFRRFERYGLDSRFIPVFVDKIKFNPSVTDTEIRHKYKLDGCLIVLSPKMFYEICGLEYIIQAFKIVSRNFKDAKLLLVGDGPLKPRISQLTKDLGLEGKVIFAGVFPPSEMPKVYSTSDVVVFHALGGIQRTALIEAMASGKPCIGTNISPFTEVLTDGQNGFLVEPKNVQQLAEALDKTLRDAKLRRLLGANARRTIEKKYTDEVASEVISVYEGLARSSCGRGK
jgi:glycosyltransferase involved in cell wall biosynthesis